jgi:hypothetical protein
VIAIVPIGQAPQAISYVPNAVPERDGTQGLQALGVAGQTTHLALAPRASGNPSSTVETAPTSVSLFDQGLVQVLQASVTGLEPKQPYVLALSHHETGAGTVEPLSAFMTNPAGSAIVNAIGPIRQAVQAKGKNELGYLVIVKGTPAKLGALVQVQVK